MATTTVMLPSKSLLKQSDRTGWRVLTGFIAFTALALVAHGGRAVDLGFAPAAVLVGLYLLMRYPRVYLVFTLLLLCTAPFVRRVADNGGPILSQSPIMAAPVLVAFISVLRSRRLRVFEPKNLVFVLAALAIFYGALVGVLSGGLKAVALPLVSWFNPLAMGLFCYLHEDDDQSMAKTFNRATVVIGVVIAIYGIWQFFSPPVWDTYWLTQMQADGQLLSMGKPEPMGLRVFAMSSNSQGAGSLYGFAILLAALSKSRWKLVIIPLLLFALALTSVRSAWVACAIGGVILLARADTKARVTAGLIGIVLVLGAFATASTPLGDIIGGRLSSFGSVKDDTSYQEREAGRAEVLKIVQREPFGLGLGYATSQAKRIHFSATDLGITTMPIELGYVGALFYAITIAIILFGPLWKGLRRRGTTYALALCLLFMTLMFANTNPLNNALGILFWVPAGLLLREFAPKTRVEMHNTMRASETGIRVVS